MASLAAIALSFPDVVEGVACAGTRLESRTFATNGKAFLFVSSTDARLKLADSAREAKRLGFAVGANGWVKVPLDALPTTPVVRRWIAESRALVAGKPGAPATGRRRQSAAKPRG